MTPAGQWSARRALQPMLSHVSGKGLGLAITILVTNAMTEPLAEDVKDVFGGVIWHHPMTVWAVILAIVGLQTSSILMGVIVVCMYEMAKMVWRALNLEAPRATRMRKLMHRCQRGEDMDDDDVAFIDEVTPKNIKVMRVDAPGNHA